MYIQITTRCNYDCRHCCFSCTRKGEDMDLYVYRRALMLSEGIGEECIFLGGGEPTIHPKFIEFYTEALEDTPLYCVWFVTNGSRKKVMQKVERLHDIWGSKGTPCLSNDIYHQECSARNTSRGYETFQYIYQMFKRNGWDVRTQKNISAMGRGSNISDKYYCICEDTFITPNGDVYGCGCKQELLGNVCRNLSALADNVYKWQETHDGCSMREY